MARRRGEELTGLCLQVEELEEKLSDRTQEVERLRSELVRPCWMTFLRNPGNVAPHTLV